jgi:membrane-bound lytic murein transglycosylase F
MLLTMSGKGKASTRRSLVIAALGVCALAVVSAGGCGGEEAPGAPSAPQDDRPALRVIVRPDPVEFLPRNAEPVALDREIAAGLAERLDRRLELIVEEDYAEMLDRLVAGEADVVAASVTVTPERAERVAFSRPYLHVDERLLMPSDADAPESVEQLAGLEVCVRSGSSYEQTLRGLQEEGVAVVVTTRPEDVATERIIEQVADGVCPATLVDSHYWSALESFYETVRPVLTVAPNRPIALALPPGADELRRIANEWLVEHALTGDRERVYRDDLPGLEQRGRLRVITQNSAATYFLHRGRSFGFEYELLERFAKKQGLRVEIVIPPDAEQMIPYLLEGKGDVVAALMAITPERAADVSFTRPYLFVDEVVVARTGDDVAGPADLAGRTLHVRASSSYYEALVALRETVPDLQIETVPEELRTEEILARVDEGEWDLTVADETLLHIEQTYGRDLEATFPLTERREIAWAVRPDAEHLRAALDGYIEREYRGLFYNMRKRRYFESRKHIAEARDEWRSDVSGQISPWDEMVREQAEKLGLDWRLVLAQMYQESGFEPDRRSWAGALGLMQVLPRTARAVDVDDPRSPRGSIIAGTRYLRRMIDRFDPKLPLAVRYRFGLAAYNAGYGHVSDARRLARERGLPADRWYEAAEESMLLLEDPQYHRKARYGYCRGSEPVRYVREIEARYRRYLRHVPSTEPPIPSDPPAAAPPAASIFPAAGR